MDGLGAARCVLAAALPGAPLLAVLGFVGSLAVLAVLWTVLGAASQLMLVGVHTLALRGETSPGGAVSVVQSMRFFGQAAAPVGFLPVYHLAPAAGFAVPALLLVLLTPLALRPELR